MRPALRIDSASSAHWWFLFMSTMSKDGRDRLAPPVDSPMQPRTPAPGWADFVPEIGPRDGDLIIAKHQWGAFYGTELDLQLRRRKIDTIVMGGIATNMGVESTARDAYELGYGRFWSKTLCRACQPRRTNSRSRRFSRESRESDRPSRFWKRLDESTCRFGGTHKIFPKILWVYLYRLCITY